jgi:hypothetical protein
VGTAIFKLSKHEDKLDFRLIVANVAEVTAAHIHRIAGRVNGPVGVPLFSSGPVSLSGELASGTIMAPDGRNGCRFGDLATFIIATQTSEA